jgi:uncharacterized protein YlaI
LKLKCTLCDKTTELDDNTIEAKRYVNHPLLVYLCPDCHERIAEKALERLRRRDIPVRDEQ